MFHSKQLRRERLYTAVWCVDVDRFGVSATEFAYGLAVSAAGVTKHQYQLFIYQLSETLKETNPSHSLLPHCYRRHLYWSIIHVFVLCIAMLGLLYRVYQSKILIMNTKYEHVTHMTHSLRICFGHIMLRSCGSCSLLNSFYMIGKFRNSIGNTEEWNVLHECINTSIWESF